jgi:hypothetical protein
MLLGHNSREFRIESNRTQFQIYENFCVAMGESPADVALAWLLVWTDFGKPQFAPRFMIGKLLEVRDVFPLASAN